MEKDTHAPLSGGLEPAGLQRAAQLGKRRRLRICTRTLGRGGLRGGARARAVGRRAVGRAHALDLKRRQRLAHLRQQRARGGQRAAVGGRARLCGHDLRVLRLGQHARVAPQRRALVLRAAAHGPASMGDPARSAPPGLRARARRVAGCTRPRCDRLSVLHLVHHARSAAQQPHAASTQFTPS